jgi:hypothetical protein
MKRTVSILVFSAFLFQGSQAMAMQQGTPEYEKMKEYKKAQHEKKSTAPAEKGFWQKEAERSGLAGTCAAATNVVSSVLPLDKPSSHK